MSDLTTTDKTTLVNAINEVKGDAGDLADLSNLTETGEERLHALKAYSDKGELLTDAEGLSDVIDYAHSTFDISKFTNYRSPVISDDGIATGLDGSNGIYVPTLTPSTSSWEVGIEQEVTAEGIQATSSTSNFVLFTDNPDLGVNVQTFYSNTNYDNFPVFIKCSDDTNINLQCTSTTGQKVSVGDVQKLVLGYNASTTTYYFKAYKNGQEYASNLVVSDKILKQTASNNTIGFRRAIRGNLNKIDLKTYYVIIDGYPIFKGTQTGIDTYTIGGNTVSVPYTLSKTGSKIVDSVYRPQVTAVYNEYGNANYYTLDEANGNFTLPQGEIYGMFEPKNKWVYADQTNAISTATATGTYDLTSAVTSVLPVDSDNYECLFRYGISRKQTGGSTNTNYTVTVSSNIVLKEVIDSAATSGGADTNDHCGQFTAIIDKTRAMSLEIDSQVLNTSNLYLVAY